MGKKGGGGGSQTVVEKNDPPEVVAPYLAELYPKASAWMNGGSQGYYPGQTVANANPQMLEGLYRTASRGLNGSALQQQAQGTARQFASGEQQGNNPLLNKNSWLTTFARGDGISSNPWAQGKMTGQNVWANGSGWLSNRTAQGAMLSPDNNPYMRGMVDAASRPIVENFQNSIAPSLASQFSAAGRTGSGAHVGAFQGAASTLGRQLSDTSSNLYGQAYQMERGFQEQAFENERQKYFNAYEAEQQRRQGAFDRERGMQYDATARTEDRYAGAVENERSRMFQSLGLAPALDAMDYTNLNAASMAGQGLRDIDQSFIDGNVERYNYNRDEPLQRLMGYSSILQGATPYMSSSQSSTSNAAKYNRLSGTVGGGLGGYAMGAMIPAIGGPMGALLGGLGGLFG